MNSIKNSLSGLSSSLFLAAGLTRLAEQTDPMLKQNQQALTKMQSVESCEICGYPCNFTPQSGQ